MAIINRKHLRHYLDLKYNVLFRGQHGVGKTQIIKSVFDEKYGVDGWRYFSASTLDPWVDFVGIPKVIEVPEAPGSVHTKSILKMIRPDFIENDTVKAIFFDEYNRAPDKVLNATMELIQFKSINGHRLKNLEVIWAAINPSDDEDTYSVNHVDPAQLDRFEIHIDVPFKVDEEYFLKKYPDCGQMFIDWWKALPDDIRFLVSPRRLDMAAHAWLNECRLEDVLPYTSSPKKLREMLKALPFTTQLKKIKTLDEATQFLSDPNNTFTMLDMIKAGEKSAIDLLRAHGKLLPSELIAPYLDWFEAKEKGLEIVTSLEEVIAKLPDGMQKADSGTAAWLNNLDFSKLYAKGGSIEADIRALNGEKQNVVKKLANRLCDIILSCRTSTIERVMWGLAGRRGNEPTNYQKMLKAVGSIPTMYTDRQKRSINSKLYESNIVDVQQFI